MWQGQMPLQAVPKGRSQGRVLRLHSSRDNLGVFILVIYLLHLGSPIHAFSHMRPLTYVNGEETELNLRVPKRVLKGLAFGSS